MSPTVQITTRRRGQSQHLHAKHSLAKSNAKGLCRGFIVCNVTYLRNYLTAITSLGQTRTKI